MSEFIPTVTITVAEYDRLRKDAAPVQSRRELAWRTLAAGLTEYRHALENVYVVPRQDVEERLFRYVRYCIHTLQHTDDDLMQFNDNWPGKHYSTQRADEALLPAKS